LIPVSPLFSQSYVKLIPFGQITGWVSQASHPPSTSQSFVRSRLSTSHLLWLKAHQERGKSGPHKPSTPSLVKPEFFHPLLFQQLTSNSMELLMPNISWRFHLITLSFPHVRLLVHYQLYRNTRANMITIDNRLSISTITTSYPNLPSCNIKYVEFPAALSKIGTDTWAVGPPQSVISIQCPPFHPVV